MNLARRSWDRWRITILYAWTLLLSLALVIGLHIEADKRVQSACASVTQVKNAALGLTGRTSSVGVTDPATLERIRVANAAKTEARRQLERGLACRN